jgi:hypothetical protein
MNFPQKTTTAGAAAIAATEAYLAREHELTEALGARRYKPISGSIDGAKVTKEEWGELVTPDRRGLGRMIRLRGRKIAEILSDLKLELEVLQPGIMEEVEYLERDVLDRHDHPDKEYPAKVRRIACYATTGSSEGHYVHIDVLIEAADRRSLTVVPLATAKTFLGMQTATRFAAACAVLLGA